MVTEPAISGFPGDSSAAFVGDFALETRRDTQPIGSIVARDALDGPASAPEITENAIVGAVGAA